MTNQGTRLAGSIIHAANETAPLIVDGIQEFTDQIPLITGFASAYAEVNAEQTQKVTYSIYFWVLEESELKETHNVRLSVLHKLV